MREHEEAHAVHVENEKEENEKHKQDDQIVEEKGDSMKKMQIEEETYSGKQDEGIIDKKIKRKISVFKIIPESTLPENNLDELRKIEEAQYIQEVMQICDLD